MLRKILISFVIVLCLISSAYARPRVTVYDFTDESEQHDAPAGAIMHMMVTEVSKAGIFSLLERVNLEHIGREQKLITEGLIDPETAFERQKPRVHGKYHRVSFRGAHVRGYEKGD